MIWKSTLLFALALASHVSGQSIMGSGRPLNLPGLSGGFSNIPNFGFSSSPDNQRPNLPQMIAQIPLQGLSAGLGFASELLRPFTGQQGQQGQQGQNPHYSYPNGLYPYFPYLQNGQNGPYQIPDVQGIISQIPQGFQMPQLPQLQWPQGTTSSHGLSPVPSVPSMSPVPELLNQPQTQPQPEQQRNEEEKRTQKEEHY